MKVRYIWLISALAVLAVGAALITRSGATAATGNRQAVDATFADLDGKVVKLSDYRGKVLVVDVWATWCGYCVRSIPDLIAYQERVEENEWNVQLLGVSVDRHAKTVKEFASAKKINYPLAIADTNALKPLGNISGIPVKFLLNEQGVIVDKRIGPLSGEALERWVAPHLSK